MASGNEGRRGMIPRPMPRPGFPIDPGGVKPGAPQPGFPIDPGGVKPGESPSLPIDPPVKKPWWLNAMNSGVY